MRRALVVLAALAFVGTANADTFIRVGQDQGPSYIVVPTTLTPANPSAAESQQISTANLQSLWMGAGAAYGIPWPVLAAINKIESNFGQNMGPSSAGAIGWMQFMPGTWSRWGVDANGDGVADPWNAADAIYSAARYLSAAGGTTDLARAIFAYNHAGWYVNEVLSLASLYANGGPAIVPMLEQLQAALKDARTNLAGVNAQLGAALTTTQALARSENRTLARSRDAALLSDQLALQKRAVQIGVRQDAADARVQQLRNELAGAQQNVTDAVERSNAATFNPAGAQLLAAPAHSGNYVFPVGGGPGVVSVGHTHHDYPAADIDAPMGSPVYALSDGIVVDAWAAPEGNCGIGVIIATTDGQKWTYCHLSYLYPTIRQGAQLAAGDNVGLVGATGDATGPHLHLQLDPSMSYPQDEAWFAGFAGTAFTWQGAAPAQTILSASPVTSGPVFTTVGDPVVEFSQNVVQFTR